MYIVDWFCIFIIRIWGLLSHWNVASVAEEWKTSRGKNIWSRPWKRNGCFSDEGEWWGYSRVSLGKAKTFEQALNVSDRAPGVGNGWGRGEKSWNIRQNVMEWNTMLLFFPPREFQDGQRERHNQDSQNKAKVSSLWRQGPKPSHSVLYPKFLGQCMKGPQQVFTE